MKRIAGLSGLLALFVCVAVATAQEQSGSIQGVVKDPQGAVLPGATIEARNPLTGASTVASNTDRASRSPALAPGRYEITATLQGFKSAKKTDAVLELGKTLTIEL